MSHATRKRASAMRQSFASNRTTDFVRIEDTDDGPVEFVVAYLHESGLQFERTGDTVRSSTRAWKTFRGALDFAGAQAQAQEEKKYRRYELPLAILVIREPFGGKPMIYVAWSRQGGPTQGTIYERKQWEFKQAEEGNWVIV